MHTHTETQRRAATPAPRHKARKREKKSTTTVRKKTRKQDGEKRSKARYWPAGASCLEGGGWEVVGEVGEGPRTPTEAKQKNNN